MLGYISRTHAQSIGVAVSATASAALVMIRAGFDAMSAAAR